ncbi:hypothetical protein JCM10213_008362 [Rhodosporidiobolus nylandii]
MEQTPSYTSSNASGDHSAPAAPPGSGASSLPFPPPEQPVEGLPQPPSVQHNPQPQQQLPSPSPVSPNFPPAEPSSLPGPPPQPSSASLLPPFPVPGDSSAAPSPAASTSTAPPPAPASGKRGPAIVSYDPDAASGGEEDSEDAEGAGGSPKKKRKAAGGRAASARAAAAAADGGGSGNASATGEPEKGRRKIEIEYIQKKEKRHITFSKRKAGIMKKAYELATLTGTEVLLLVVSETGIVYTFTTTKFQPLVGAGENGQPSEGQRLIQQCLAVSPEDEKDSDYISPPPDGPLLPLPPSAQKRPFEANSSIHGGQIALRTKQHRPRNKRPAPIVPPGTGPGSSASLPTPGIHAQMDQMQNMPMSPHQLHPLNPAPPGQGFPPSPGFAPQLPLPPPSLQQTRDALPSPMQTSREYQEMMERSQQQGGNGYPPPPGPSYPPPPALGYTHQLPNPPPPGPRPPHPLDPYPPHHHSPNSSPRSARHLPPPPPHHQAYQPAAPRTLGGRDPYAAAASDHQRPTYGGPPPPPGAAGEDTRMMSPYAAHAQIPSNPQLPNPPPELWQQAAAAAGGGPPPGQGVVIQCYDFQRPSTPSPLYPATRSRLPPPLDAELRQLIQQGRLVLPPSASNSGFWRTRLPSTKKLDTTTPSTLSAASSTPPQQLSPSSPPLVRPWSESFGLPSPPAIATAELWTPSKSLEFSPSSSSSSSKQEAVLDFRFGPLSIDWIDNPSPRPLSMRSHSSSPPPGFPALGSSARPEEKAGTTDLYWGTIHLYREQGASEADSSREEKQRARDEDDGRTIGMVSVPGVLNAAALLAFIAPALESVEQVRMLRDATPNRSLVLIRFKSAASASEFKRVYNGRPYHDSKDSEICHLVHLSSIKLKSTSTPPFTFPYTPADLSSPSSSSASGATEVELPSCPVCLETLDARVSGLVQIPCQHSYHCSCLLKWGDSRCPVCRATNARTGRRNTLTSSNSTSAAAGGDGKENKCAVCQSPSNLWLCVLCGHAGCGRYQGGHAHSHFGETGHSYSLEIETGRIWSYCDDEYVHRLIRLRPNPADPTSPSGASRLIELPSLSSASRTAASSDPDDLSSKIGAQHAHGGGPSETAAAEQDKLEALAVEYGNLMSAQLEEQREYYEDELARVKDLKRQGDIKRDELDREIALLRREGNEAIKREKDREARWAKEREGLQAQLEALRKDAARERDERKKERSEAAKAKKALEAELASERAVTASLTANLSSLRTELAAQQGETQGVKAEVDDLREQLNDLMAALSMRDKVEADSTGEWAGASIGVAPAPSAQQVPPRNPSRAKAEARKKKKK